MDGLFLAKENFQEYRLLAENEVTIYSDLVNSHPGASFPKAAARVWRYGMLAQMWGILATTLCGGKVDYIADWRAGRLSR